MLTESKNKVMQPKHSKDGPVFEVFPNDKAHWKNNNEENFMELNPLTHPVVPIMCSLTLSKIEPSFCDTYSTENSTKEFSSMYSMFISIYCSFFIVWRPQWVIRLKFQMMYLKKQKNSFSIYNHEN
jgi:hypothetical protein